MAACSMDDGLLARAEADLTAVAASQRRLADALHTGVASLKRKAREFEGSQNDERSCRRREQREMVVLVLDNVVSRVVAGAIESDARAAQRDARAADATVASLRAALAVATERGPPSLSSPRRDDLPDGGAVAAPSPAHPLDEFAAAERAAASATARDDSRDGARAGDENAEAVPSSLLPGDENVEAVPNSSLPGDENAEAVPSSSLLPGDENADPRGRNDPWAAPPACASAEARELEEARDALAAACDALARANAEAAATAGRNAVLEARVRWLEAAAAAQPLPPAPALDTTDGAQQMRRFLLQKLGGATAGAQREQASPIAARRLVAST